MRGWRELKGCYNGVYATIGQFRAYLCVVHILSDQWCTFCLTTGLLQRLQYVRRF